MLKYSETTGPTEAKFNGAPPWDRGKDGKLIQMFCCYSLLSTPEDGDIYHTFGPAVQRFQQGFEVLRDNWCIIPDFVKVRNILQPSFDFFANGKDRYLNLPTVAKLSYRA